MKRKIHLYNKFIYYSNSFMMDGHHLHVYHCNFDLHISSELVIFIDFIGLILSTGPAKIV